MSIRAPFDSIALFRDIDSRTEKKHETPFHGQVWIQLHDNGHSFATGTVEGIQYEVDGSGNLVKWACYIRCGFRHQAERVNSGDTWRSPANWHAAPASLQTDLAATVADLERKLGTAAREITRLREEAGHNLKLSDVEEVLTALDTRLTSLEGAGGGPRDEDIVRSSLSGANVS